MKLDRIFAKLSRVFDRLAAAARVPRVLWRKKWLESLGDRPSSTPFISGDSVRSLCDHRFGDSSDEPLDWSSIQPGARVFCKSDALEAFFREVRSRRLPKLHLFSGNGDRNVDQQIVDQLPETVATWAAQNLVTPETDRISVLPIGLENRHYDNHGVVEDFLRLRREPKPSAALRILYGFSVRTNPLERQSALDSAVRCPVAESLPACASRRYRRTLRRYAFVLSPPGNGLDCHRTWEALYLGVIPVVRRSAMVEALYRRGVPLFIVDRWTDLESLTKDSLADIHMRESPKFPTAPLWLKDWIAPREPKL